MDSRNPFEKNENELNEKDDNKDKNFDRRIKNDNENNNEINLLNKKEKE